MLESIHRKAITFTDIMKLSHIAVGMEVPYGTSGQGCTATSVGNRPY
jgi:hypothetical protein